jgi:hypothetical protein
MTKDQVVFWKQVERLLAPPATTNGPAPAETGRNYRSGAFSTNVRLAVDALDDGTMRVHLHTEDATAARRLRGLAKRMAAGTLPAPSGPRPSVTVGRGGRRVYFGSTWGRSGAYRRELPAVERLLGWLVRWRDAITP